MSLQIRTFIGNDLYFLDLYQDEPLRMNLSFAEIQNITQKNSSFSQSFNLPGTKKNNRIFDYYYEVTSLPTNFDPNKKFPAIITWDGIEVLQGNIRLENVVYDNGNVIYNATFYNQVGDLAANIGDKFLRDLDLSHLSHPYSADVILQSQYDPNLFPLTGSTNYSYQNGKTMWGLYNIGYNYISGNSVDYQTTPLVYFTPISGGTYNPLLGYFDFSATPVWDYYFKPTIQVKELYESICREAGYSIESNFFNTAYFQRYYLPQKFLDESPYSRGSTIACFSYYNALIPNASYLNFTNPSTGQTCNSLNWSANTTQFNIPTVYPATYTFRFTFDVIPLLDCSDPANIPTFFLIMNDGINAYNVLIEQVCATPNNPLPRQVDFTLTTTGANIETYFIFNECYVSGFTSTLISPLPRFLVSGTTIDYALEFPDNDYKQIDFITSINRYFNLVCVPSPDNEKNIIVEPIIDFIGKGDVLDWTTKVDRLQPIQISPTTSLVNGTLLYNFRLDQDWANQNFQKSSNRIFGTERKKLNIDYKDSSITFDSMFSSPLDITIYSFEPSYLTLPSFSKLQQQDKEGEVEQQFVPFKILPRLLFRGVTMNQDTYGYVGGTGSTSTQYQNWYVKAAGSGFTEDHFLEMNRFTTYPWNYNNFSHYTNWRGEDTTNILPAEETFIAEDLYDIYYSDYIEDLISKENKIVSCKIYLTPWDIKSLKFNEKILIDNTYYRINKIENFNLLEPSICDLELIKLTKEYRGHRIINYRFDPCTAPGDTLYSNSDLMYNMFAYIGRFVELFDDQLNYLGCFQVYEDVAGIGIGQQEHYFISSGFTNQGVNIYEDCGCTGRTGMIIVQEIPEQDITPSPTPSITPTNTPSNSPTPSITASPSLTPTTTMTPTNTNTPSITPSPTPFDSDATTFLNAVVATGGTLNSTISAATNTLFTSLKSNGLYTSMKAMYPFIGSTSGSCAINAVSPGTYDITWFGGMSFGVSGATGNGSNGWGNTNLIQTAFTQNSVSAGVYQITSLSGGAEFVFGNFSTGGLPAIQLSTYLTTLSGNYAYRLGSSTITQQTYSGNTGMFVISRTTGDTTTHNLYRNGSLINSTSNSYTASATPNAIYVFGRQGGGGTTQEFSPQTLAFIFFGDGFSGSQVSTLSSIINTFNTSLGRNVY